jgi:predicted DNA-binding transcriptional regulator AlpA
MADRLVSIRDIRTLFALGRTAAYELTHRADFPEPVVVSPRCYRWWASEVITFAAHLRSERTEPVRTTRRAAVQAVHPNAPPLRINGTVRAARTRRSSS